YPSGRAAPQIVQAPALEALELVGPSPRRTRSTPESQPPTPAAAAPAARSAAPGTEPRPERQRPQQPPRRPGSRPSTAPRANVPDVPDLPNSAHQHAGKQVPQGPGHVCALGRKYGGWQPGSPESTICDDTYGR
ncbi:MAG TPA: hypothetical protein VK545_06135, partial [Streptomyces sp.]|nr:hypothetical protein [Streptomyces sp.]